MAPSEFSLRLQKGITGGFAPPTPSAIHTITLPRTAPPTLSITSALRADGTPDLHSVSALPRSLALSAPTTTSSTSSPSPSSTSASAPPSAEALVDELYALLKDLPTEHPAGSEDIYGLDTQLAFGSAELEWCNGGPQGCGGGRSSVQASAGEKAKFQRAVQIVEALVGSAR